MTVRASLSIARRFLFGGRRIRAFSRRVRGGVIGVGLSLVPLVVVLQVADGMIAGITARYLETGSYHIQGVARRAFTPDELDAITARARAVAGVTVAAPERQGVGLASAADRRTAVTIRAVAPDLFDLDAGLRRYLEIRSGAWDLTTPQSIVLGEQVARRLGVAVGDEVRILTARTLASGRLLPRTSGFVVRGIVSSGYSDLDRLWAFVAFDRGTAILPEESSRLVIGVKIAAPLDLPNPLFTPRSTGAAQARTLLSALRVALGDDFRAMTWFESSRAQFMSFKTTKDLLVFIMVLIVTVAAVNISSTLVMLVLEKQEEIAVLKSLGASPAGIRRVFMACGFVIGALGTGFGLLLGLLIALNINEVLYAVEWGANAVVASARFVVSPFLEIRPPSIELLSGGFYLEQIPIVIEPRDLLLIALLSLLLSCAAAWFPSQRAARVRPLEVLRKH